MFSKSSLKIPMSFHSNESSHTNSPTNSPVRFIHVAAASGNILGPLTNNHHDRSAVGGQEGKDRSSVGGLERNSMGGQDRSCVGGSEINSVRGSYVGGAERGIVGGPDEEVRSKLTSRARKQRAESVTAECGEDGVKSIMDILNCADVQLQTSRDFAKKLAKRR